MKSALTSLVLLAMAVSLRAQTLAPLPDDGFVRLEQIVSDFNANPTAAAQKYQGQRLKVYGRVGKVRTGTGEAGNPLVVFLQLPGGGTPDVKAKFTASAFPDGVGVNVTEKQATLYRHNGSGADIDMGVFISKDQNVGISGSVKTYFAGDLVLTDCQKIPKARLHDLLKAHPAQ